jgi:hypothetical protein
MSVPSVTLDLNALFVCFLDYVLPNRFLQMYENMNEDMKDSIRTGRLETMTPENFAKLPIPLFLLIPVSTTFHSMVNISA